MAYACKACLLGIPPLQAAGEASQRLHEHEGGASRVAFPATQLPAFLRCLPCLDSNIQQRALSLSSALRQVFLSISVLDSALACRLLVLWRAWPPAPRAPTHTHTHTRARARMRARTRSCRARGRKTQGQQTAIAADSEANTFAARSRLPGPPSAPRSGTHKQRGGVFLFACLQLRGPSPR